MRPITARRRPTLAAALAALTMAGTLGGVAQPAAAAPVSDPVLFWNDVLLEVFRDEGGAPTPMARGGAMMHAAIYDAVNSITPVGRPYLYQTSAPNASVRHAVAYAAHDTLVAAFPGVEFSDDLADALDGAADSGNGRAVGEAAADALIAARTDDGANDTVAYPVSTQPGQWRPTGRAAAATPHWGRVKPFTATSLTQFRPAPPAGYATMPELLASPEYAAQVDEVRRLGGANSTARTEEQTRIAHFWANDLDDSYKPPGQLFVHTQIVAGQRGLDTAQKARLFALVGLTMGDAGIVAWDAKYQTDIDLWRPESAIRLADTDGNPATAADPSWQPLSPDEEGNRFSPPFPAYVSGHATFAAAWAGAMRAFFGTDAITFTATTEDVHAAGVTRTFPTFSAAARENARSRVYLGVHYQFDADSGLSAGTALAQHAATTFLRG